CDAGGQVEPMEAAVARLDRHGQLGILEAFGVSVAAERLQEVPERDVHAFGDGLYRQDHVGEPGTQVLMSQAKNERRVGLRDYCNKLRAARPELVAGC